MQISVPARKQYIDPEKKWNDDTRYPGTRYLGRVVRVFAGTDGVVRSAETKVALLEECSSV